MNLTTILYILYSLQRNNPIASISEPDWQEQEKQVSFTSILLIDDEEDILYTFKEAHNQANGRANCSSIS